MKRRFAISTCLLALLLTVPEGTTSESPAPDRITQHNELGTVFALQGRYDLAKRQYETALSMSRANSALLNNMGNLRLLASHVDSAIALYEAAAELEPDDGGIHLNLGIALYVAGHEDESQSTIRAAVRQIGSAHRAAEILGLHDIDTEVVRASEKPIDRETIKRLLKRASERVPADTVSVANLREKPRPRQTTIRAGIKGDAVENLRKVLYWKVIFAPPSGD